MSNAVATNEPKWLTQETKELIRKQFFPAGASDLEMQYCMSVAKDLDLNPILKQIFFVSARLQVNGKWIERVEPRAGRDSFLSIAHRSGKFNGIKSYTEIREVPRLTNDGWKTQKELVAVAEVRNKDLADPVIVEVNYNEYIQRKMDGSLTKFWREKPNTMLKKVAESQALRKAFDIRGIFAEEEISTDREATIASEAQATKIEDLLPQPKSEAVEDEIVADSETGEVIDAETEVAEPQAQTETAEPKIGGVFIAQMIKRKVTRSEAILYLNGSDKATIKMIVDDVPALDQIAENIINEREMMI